MIVTQLRVTNFRNIAGAYFMPASALTVICGKNGQGKTNLLESVWMLTGSKSFRGARDIELVREKCDFAVLEGCVTGDRPLCTLREKQGAPCGQAPCAQTQEQKYANSAGAESYEKNIRIAVAGEGIQPRGRTAKVNGAAYGQATNLAGILTAVVFDPGHLSLIKGSPEGRRRFLDAALCQLYPRYLPLLRQYGRLVTQKNALLKNYYATAGAGELLEVFNEKMAEYGTQISRQRQEYLNGIVPDAVKNYDDIANGGEKLCLAYEPCCADGALFSLLCAAKPRELAAGFCTAGPHREDFSVYLDGRAAKTYASQGQQRSAVLSLKLAEAAMAQRVTGEHPVMLLDDVLSELDETRQSYLLNRMEDKQTIVTACDAGLFSRTNGMIYYMEQGSLVRKQ
ncbi:MAG: DNA replication/repair protein RecF [Ruthenibacterium sp.]